MANNIKIPAGQPNPLVSDRYALKCMQGESVYHLTIVGFNRALCGKMTSGFAHDADDEFARTFCRQCVQLAEAGGAVG